MPKIHRGFVITLSIIVLIGISPITLLKECFACCLFMHVVLKKAKTLLRFGISECNTILIMRAVIENSLTTLLEDTFACCLFSPSIIKKSNI